MRTYKEVTQTRKTEDKYFCDKCGKEIKHYGDYMLFDNIKVSFEYSAWGDAWDEYKWEVEDLCLQCCRELELLLKENGYKVKVHEEWDEGRWNS